MNATTKELASQLYAEMDRTVPGWRRMGFPDFDAAVQAAGARAGALCDAWRTSFKRKTSNRLAEQDARKATAEGTEGEDKEVTDNSPVFDRGGAGHRIGMERRDEPGREQSGFSEEGESRGASVGRREDSLYYPDGRPNVPPSPCHDEPFKWSPVPPRSYGAFKSC
jgi:hypothetical protein